MQLHLQQSALVSRIKYNSAANVRSSLSLHHSVLTISTINQCRHICCPHWTGNIDIKMHKINDNDKRKYCLIISCFLCQNSFHMQLNLQQSALVSRIKYNSAANVRSSLSLHHSDLTISTINPCRNICCLHWTSNIDTKMHKINDNDKRKYCLIISCFLCQNSFHMQLHLQQSALVSRIKYNSAANVRSSLSLHHSVLTISTINPCRNICCLHWTSNIDTKMHKINDNDKRKYCLIISCFLCQNSFHMQLHLQQSALVSRIKYNSAANVRSSLSLHHSVLTISTINQCRHICCSHWTGNVDTKMHKINDNDKRKYCLIISCFLCQNSFHRQLNLQQSALVSRIKYNSAANVRSSLSLHHFVVFNVIIYILRIRLRTLHFRPFQIGHLYHHLHYKPSQGWSTAQTSIQVPCIRQMPQMSSLHWVLCTSDSSSVSSLVLKAKHRLKHSAKINTSAMYQTNASNVIITFSALHFRLVICIITCTTSQAQVEAHRKLQYKCHVSDKCLKCHHYIECFALQTRHLYHHMHYKPSQGWSTAQTSIQVPCIRQMPQMSSLHLVLCTSDLSSVSSLVLKAKHRLKHSAHIQVPCIRQMPQMSSLHWVLCTSDSSSVSSLALQAKPRLKRIANFNTSAMYQTNASNVIITLSALHFRLVIRIITCTTRQAKVEAHRKLQYKCHVSDKCLKCHH